MYLWNCHCFLSLALTQDYHQPLSSVEWLVPHEVLPAEGQDRGDQLPRTRVNWLKNCKFFFLIHQWWWWWWWWWSGYHGDNRMFSHVHASKGPWKPQKDNFSWDGQWTLETTSPGKITSHGKIKKEALETRETHITYHGLHPTTSVCSGFVFSCS